MTIDVFSDKDEKIKNYLAFTVVAARHKFLGLRHFVVKEKRFFVSVISFQQRCLDTVQ